MTAWKTLRLGPRLRAIDGARAREALACYSFLGCAGGTDLLKNLRSSYAAARSFAESADFRRALARLGRTGLERLRAPMPADRCILLVAHGSLRALALIADALTMGWRLVVEDVPFSRNFLAPVGGREPGRVEFLPGHLLPARHRAITQAGGPGATLFVTFCDRPARPVDDGVDTGVAGGRCHLSALDALLMVADFAEALVLGHELRRVIVTERVDWATGRISGETLFHYTSRCGDALSEAIAATPGHYLGMTQLVTRGAKYRSIIAGGKKSLVRSLLHYCQTNGLPLPEQSYHRLLQELDAPGVGEPRLA